MEEVGRPIITLPITKVLHIIIGLPTVNKASMFVDFF